MSSQTNETSSHAAKQRVEEGLEAPDNPCATKPDSSTCYTYRTKP